MEGIGKVWSGKQPNAQLAMKFGYNLVKPVSVS